MNKTRRTKDKGVTRGSIVDRLNIPRTIPELKWQLGSFRAPMDVRIETALRNMLADGIVEIVDEPRHCYQAARYRMVYTCIHCGTKDDLRAIYHDPECKELAYRACSVCIDVLGEMYL